MEKVIKKKTVLITIGLLFLVFVGSASAGLLSQRYVSVYGYKIYSTYYLNPPAGCTITGWNHTVHYSNYGGGDDGTYIDLTNNRLVIRAYSGGYSYSHRHSPWGSLHTHYYPGAYSATYRIYGNFPPIADAGPDKTVEQESYEGTEVTLDGSGSTDPDSTPGTNDDIIGFDWYEGGSLLGSGEIINYTFPLGPHTITLVVTDSYGETDDDEVTIDVMDTTPPEITCPDDVTVEQESYDGTVVPLEATATDICDPNPVITSDELAIYPLGETVVTFTATDASGNSASCSMTVTVVDTTPPTINSISASPDVLWPPNHKMVEVTVTIDATDICDPEPDCWILGVTSNEPINGSGDGNTEPDWEITGDLTVNLRAERAGVVTGRVYNILVDCMDASGNIATAEVDVVVPHDQGKGKGKK